MDFVFGKSHHPGVILTERWSLITLNGRASTCVRSGSSVTVLRFTSIVHWVIELSTVSSYAGRRALDQLQFRERQEKCQGGFRTLVFVAPAICSPSQQPPV